MIQDRVERQSDSFNYKEKNTITIPESSMNYIVELLSSNLYNNPYESFIRESIANAYDANVESGSIQPVEVKYSQKLQYVEIIDNGIGINKERFKNTYLSLGSSTKRSDNTQIGSFGLGRLSPLACSNNIFIDTIYYDDVKQKYVRDVYNMYKPDLGISIDLIISEELDTATTGTKIRVYVTFSSLTTPYTISSSKFPLLMNENKLLFYNLDWNLFSVPLTNNIFVKEYDSFVVIHADSINSYYSSNSAIIGNIVYRNVMPTFFDLIVRRISEVTHVTRIFNNGMCILPKFDVGEIEFTPSRDDLKRSEKTIMAVYAKAYEVAHEIYTKIIPVSMPVDALLDSEVLMTCLNDIAIDVDIDKVDLFLKRDADNSVEYKQTLSLQVNKTWKLGETYIQIPTKSIKVFDTTEKGLCIKHVDALVTDIICNNKKLIITNRPMNTAFIAEKQNEPDGYIYISSNALTRSKMGASDVKMCGDIIKYLYKHCYDGVISFQSKKDYDYIKNSTSKSRRSEKFKVSVLDDSEIRNYYYNTRFVTNYYDIEDTNTVPMILCDKLNDNACNLMRYIYRFHRNLPEEYQIKLFPDGIVFGTCSPSVLQKLTTQGKAVDFLNYLASDSLAMNILKLCLKLRKKYPIIIMDAGMQECLKAFNIPENIIKNLKMIVKISSDIIRPNDEDTRTYLDFKSINYSKFGSVLPLLKDCIYNKELGGVGCISAQLIPKRVYELSKYFIFKFTKIPTIKRLNYGR